MIKTAEIHDNEIARDVKETLRKLKAAQYVAKQPGPGLPGQVERRREDADAVAGPGRQDLIAARAPHRRLTTARGPVASACAGAATGPVVSRPSKEITMLDDTLKTQLAGLPRTPARSRSSSSRRSTTAPSRARDARAARRDRAAEPDKISVRYRRQRRAPALVRDQPRRRRHGRALRRASRWATSSPRWCWRCCRPAATRPRSTHDVIEQIKALEGDFVFETYMSLTCHNCPDVVQALNLMAVLNPRIRHVAIDGGAVPGRGRGAPDHGRADGVPERPALRLGPHGARGDPRQDRHRRGGARCRASWREGRPSTC